MLDSNLPGIVETKVEAEVQRIARMAASRNLYTCYTERRAGNGAPFLYPRIRHMLDQRFDPKAAEADIYARWEEDGCFKPSGDTSAEAYSIVIPPPNVTGVLHMGHAFNKLIAEVLIRFERMRGKNVCGSRNRPSGIATQMVVERQMAEDGGKESRASLGREGVC